MKPRPMLTHLLGQMYGRAIQVRNFLYDSGIADQISISKPVLSVGNISVGGTGKTPVVEKIISICLEKGLRPCLVARNYKAQSVGIHQVDLSRTGGACFYGDEAYSIAEKFPQVPVFTGPRKAETARHAEKVSSFDLLLVDDGFQHRALHRDFDIVLVDVTAEKDENCLLPEGRLREEFGSLERSSLVVLTKVNWASETAVQEIQKQIPAQIEQVQLEFSQKPKKEIPEGCRVLAVSGIARPLVFEQGLKSMGAAPVESLRFPDHHPYGQEDLIKIIQKCRSLDCGQILTTEKDFVKLKEFPELLPFLNPIELQLKFKTEPRGLYAFLDQCLGR